MNLDGLVLSVSTTAAVGVVDSNTVLRLRQQGDRVFGRYSGGSISRGCLVGRIEGHRLSFRYAQVEGSSQIHGGSSVCEMLYKADGRARIVEHFTWRTREGSGTNVFDEVLESKR
ncbi:MAG TPA: hypothetical protein VJQ52_04315 [Steroidobacteraceae bacterium]|nr:hypothetical protein [Steroidobacteraceae bacterium]